MTIAILSHTGSTAEMLADLLCAPRPRRRLPSLRPPQKSARAVRRHLTDAELRRITELLARRVPCWKVAAELGVSEHTVKSISCGRRVVGSKTEPGDGPGDCAPEA